MHLPCRGTRPEFNVAIPLSPSARERMLLEVHFQALPHGVLGLGLRRVKLRNVGLENVQRLNAVVRPGFPVGLKKGAGQPRGIRLAPGAGHNVQDSRHKLLHGKDGED